MIKFDSDFVWGTSTSSYQIEGAAYEDGKGPSNWDAFVRIPGKIANNENADVSCDFYHRYRDDIALMKKLGIRAFRMSFCWSRILPLGYGDVNEKGIKFYSDVIDCLLENGIEPWVTLHHWDLPLELQMAHDGWLNPEIAVHFENYANLCFDRFGDRVKNWITLNEPWVVAILGYGHGVFAPGRVSKTEPYIAAHNLLRSHAKAVHVYRTKYQSEQKGQIGISINLDWREPATTKAKDIDAAERALLFYGGWFADPIFFGDYPQVMKDRIGYKLPEFTEEERKLLKGSTDFFGLNHYTTMYAAESEPGAPPQSVYGNGGISEDQDVTLSTDPKWDKTSMKWAIVPWGMTKLLEWISKRYNYPVIYITENGMSEVEIVTESGVHDPARIDFLQSYFTACQQAISQGVKVKGYFIWSLLDNFEWALGYQIQFGIVHVDYKTLKRTPKDSFYWFADVIKNQGFL